MMMMMSYVITENDCTMILITTITSHLTAKCFVSITDDYEVEDSNPTMARVRQPSCSLSVENESVSAFLYHSPTATSGSGMMLTFYQQNFN